MELAAPIWLWLLLAAPAAAGLAALAWRRRLRATRAWAARGLWERLLPGYSSRRLVAQTLLVGLVFAAVACTLAQPRWGRSEQRIERQGVDLVFVLDTSLSMATRDLRPSRLWVAQTLIRGLVQALPDNRIALVQAEGDGVALVPLTTDVAVIDLLLDAVQPGSLPTPGTDLGPAIERALSLFPEATGKHQVIVLLSDGEDHGDDLDQVTEELSRRGVVVHAIGVGTREGKPLELPATRAGAPVEYKRDERGNVVVSRLQEAALERLSRDTGGLYLRATGAGVDLSPIVGRVRSMEKQTFGSERINLLEERFQWPLALAILLLVAQLVVAPFGRPPSEEVR